jgi:trans-aconitate methyltransferase
MLTVLPFFLSFSVTKLIKYYSERPTFIIDIANATNFTPGGPLQIVFANASLRAYPGIPELVASKPDLDSPGIAVTNKFPEFKGKRALF